MKIETFVLGLLIALSPTLVLAETHGHRSGYAGQQMRAIKSLSASDMDDLENGRGWGLAKAAELNGVPGPVHLLEMKDEIALTEQQIKEIEAVFNEMKQDATELGLKLIQHERELNDHFANRTITEELLIELLDRIESTRKKLRYVHLSAHLKTPAIVTEEQIRLYNRLRGYSDDDPCANIPQGHDAEMWKRHNNCE